VERPMNDANFTLRRSLNGPEQSWLAQERFPFSVSKFFLSKSACYEAAAQPRRG